VPEVERAPVWEGTSRVVSATEESVFQGRFGMVAGHIFDSEKPAAILPCCRLSLSIQGS
jgi:hypothetical protein